MDTIPRARFRGRHRLHCSRRFWPDRPAYRETDVEKADLETTIQNLITGQFNDPMRVVSFNTAERWSADVSEHIAQEIQRRHDIIGEPVPAHLQDFIDSYTGHARQFALRLV